MASTPTLASSPLPAPAAGDVVPPQTLAPAPGKRLALTRIGLAGFSVVALALFAVYAAFLASRADEIGEPVPIVVPSKGAGAPFGAGVRAPDFTLSTVDGEPVKLSDFAGRPVWINVWASWCAPCRAEMPDIDAAYREAASAPAGAAGTVGAAGAGRGGSDLVLLMVSIGEDPNVVRRYLESTRYQLPVLVNPEFAITEQYRITGLPTHYFIGRDGVIKDVAIGGLKPNAMRARLAKILA